MDCIFCDIASKESDAEVIFENEKFIAFLDINPINFGHTLVIPKNHYDNFLTIGGEELLELTKLTQYLAGVVKRAVKADGFNIMSNNGVSAGQSVFHFHYHIIPRFENDSLMRLRTMQYNADEIGRYGNMIRESVKKYKDLLDG
ncbi:MAG: hypothetical protein B6D44_14705 [Ignavibacteriales bacterium UTCHB2]|jgi:histidine triad (HIT) family protein|nr:MAG: AP-4-A phosphorylase [Ignavibacteria bacterium ADurb.Bin266]OQY70701.1 MAG: hypothetical protein B6D44_14705 [Ignavibacteriales bacterium UTCHB2]HQI41040.1 HIT family protein [Ignavibacteriaceae bacterium]